MPNWCSNRLVVTGPEDAVQKLFTQVEGPHAVLDFNKIVPYPKEFLDRDEEFRKLGWEGFKEKYGPKAIDGYNSGGYEWCVKNWGTKWNASYPERETTYNGLKGAETHALKFSTAWSPPEAVISTLHKQNPETSLTLLYKEEGMCFAGETSYLRKEDSSLQPWSPGTPENEIYVEGKAYREMYPEEFEEELLDSGIPNAGPGIMAGITAIFLNKTGEPSMTTATENKEAATEVKEVKLTKREALAALTEQHVATAKGLLDLDGATGHFSGGDNLLEATLLPDVTMDMIKKVDEQESHTVLVTTRAVTEMATQGYKLSKELNNTTAKIALTGKNAIEIDTSRGGDVVLRLRKTSVNSHAGELKGVVNTFSEAVKALEAAEAAEAAK